MAEPVYIVGAGRTDFRRNVRKEGCTLGDLIVEAGRTAIADARIAPAEIGAGVTQSRVELSACFTAERSPSSKPRPSVDY